MSQHCAGCVYIGVTLLDIGIAYTERRKADLEDMIFWLHYPFPKVDKNWPEHAQKYVAVV